MGISVEVPVIGPDETWGSVVCDVGAGSAGFVDDGAGADGESVEGEAVDGDVGVGTGALIEDEVAVADAVVERVGDAGVGTPGVADEDETTGEAVDGEEEAGGFDDTVGDAGAGVVGLLGASDGASVTGAGAAVAGHFGDSGEDVHGDAGAGTGALVEDEVAVGDAVVERVGDAGAGTPGLVDEGETTGEAVDGETGAAAAGLFGDDAGLGGGWVTVWEPESPGWMVTVTISLLRSRVGTGSFAVCAGLAATAGEVLIVIRTSTIWLDGGASLMALAS